MSDVDDLIDEAARARFQGWQFSWLADSSDDPKMPWRYAARHADALARSTRALDIDTGGGEVLAALAPFAGSVVATEGYPPNIPVAGAALERVGVNWSPSGRRPTTSIKKERHPTRTRAISPSAATRSIWY